MTNFLLSMGCTLIAFSPSISLLFLFGYPKAQLVIIVTTSAFFYLLASLLSSLFSLPFTLLLQTSNNNNLVFVIIPISILCQSVMKCVFCKLYHRVETVIESSIEYHEREEIEEEERNAGGRRSRNGDGSNDRGGGDDEEEETNDNYNDNGNDNGNGNDTPAITNSETALLRLELNDVSCSLAAGIGFGSMHAILLYGTLLASENSRPEGTLYQPSCTIMPSLMNSAFMAFWFSLLDVTWMMIAFYGMRRYKENKEYKDQQQSQHQHQQQSLLSEWSFAKNQVGGKAALTYMVVTHLIVSLITTFNVIVPVNGCVIALPLLSIVSVCIMVFSWSWFKGSFIPLKQKQRIRLVSNKTNFNNHLD